jgi:hypothetical protein
MITTESHHHNRIPRWCVCLDLISGRVVILVCSWVLCGVTAAAMLIGMVFALLAPCPNKKRVPRRLRRHRPLKDGAQDADK